MCLTTALYCIFLLLGSDKREIVKWIARPKKKSAYHLSYPNFPMRGEHEEGVVHLASSVPFPTCSIFKREVLINALMKIRGSFPPSISHISRIKCVEAMSDCSLIVDYGRGVWRAQFHDIVRHIIFVDHAHELASSVRMNNCLVN